MLHCERAPPPPLTQVEENEVPKKTFNPTLETKHLRVLRLRQHVSTGQMHKAATSAGSRFMRSATSALIMTFASPAQVWSLHGSIFNFTRSWSPAGSSSDQSSSSAAPFTVPSSFSRRSGCMAWATGSKLLFTASDADTDDTSLPQRKTCWISRTGPRQMGQQPECC